MRHDFQRWITAPVFPDDEEKTHVARQVHVIGAVFLCLVFIGLVFVLCSGRYDRALPFIPVPLLVSAAWVKLRYGQVRHAALLLTIGIWLFFQLSLIDTGGIRAAGYGVNAVLTILIAGLLIGMPGVLGAIVANLLAGILLAWGEIHGWIRPLSGAEGTIPLFIAQIFWSGMAAGILFLATSSVQSALTRARQEAAERRTAEATLRLMIRQVNAILWSTDRELRFKTSEGAGLHQLQLDPNQLQGVLVADYLETAEQAAPALAAMHRALQGESVTYEQSWQGRIYRSFVEPLRDESDQIVGTVVLSLDISEHKRMEEALRVSEERYRLLIEHLPDSAVMLFDHDLRFALVDGPELERTGYSKAGMEGKTLYETIPAAFAERVEGNMRAVLAGRRFTDEIPFGDAIYAYTYVPICRESGEVVYGLILARNITARKHAEVEREQLIAELETRNAELERFTYTVSHDLKSPLITIQGFVGFLEQDARNGNFQRLQTDIHRITAAAERMQQLLDDLLELSRIGRLVNPPEAVPFADIVREALELVAGRLNARDVRVSVAPAMPTVYGDRLRLIEVMQNLLDNAARFMGHQPEPRIAVGAAAQGRQALCFVRDNGIGIEPIHHQRVFGLFERLDINAEGTGIGLALVKRIIEVHGGRIWVESAGDHTGATFWFTLPLAEAQADSAAAPR